MASTQARPAPLQDPEPVSLSLTLFAAVTAGLGVIIQWTERRRALRHDRDLARTKLLTADRALNRLDEAYRSLISVFDQEHLLDRPVPFVPGRGTLVVDSRVRAEVSRIQRAAFDAGRQLERSLDELAPYLPDSEAVRASDLVYGVERDFRLAQRAEDMTEFLLNVGRLLAQLSEFLEGSANDLDIRLPSSRLELLGETLARLARASGGGYEAT